MAANMLEEDENVTALPSSYASFGKYILYNFYIKTQSQIFMISTTYAEHVTEES